MGVCSSKRCGRENIDFLNLYDILPLMQDRIDDRKALTARQDAAPSRSEEAGAVAARALIATTSYIRQGIVELAVKAKWATVEGAKATGRGVWGFSKGFAGEVAPRGSQRLR